MRLIINRDSRKRYETWICGDPKNVGIGKTEVESLASLIRKLSGNGEGGDAVILVRTVPEERSLYRIKRETELSGL